MQSFIRETALAAVIPGDNLDTDQIIPARFLKFDRSAGYGQFLFHDLRFDEAGAERPGFVLNQQPFRAAKILVTGENFGCGSSREGAVYALCDYGVRAVVGPSFGDIFYNNALKNGLIPVRLDASEIARLREAVREAPGAEIAIDLEQEFVLLPGGRRAPLSIDPFWRECILKGVDEIDLTLGYMAEIEAFERNHLARTPWIDA
jgi:3-isopropylmalate/(R)-2-methylmalate dehydratase small subunit